MTTDRIRALEELLAEAQAAHGVFEATELAGVYDEDWPRWYAEYSVEHGIGAVLGREVTADELAAYLAKSWDEFRQADPKPADAWATYTARRMAAQPYAADPDAAP